MREPVLGPCDFRIYSAIKFNPALYCRTLSLIRHFFELRPAKQKKERRPPKTDLLQLLKRCPGPIAPHATPASTHRRIDITTPPAPFPLVSPSAFRFLRSNCVPLLLNPFFITMLRTSLRSARALGGRPLAATTASASAASARSWRVVGASPVCKSSLTVPRSFACDGPRVRRLIGPFRRDSTPTPRSRPSSRPRRREQLPPAPCRRRRLSRPRPRRPSPPKACR